MKPVVMIPTFNEAENIGCLIEEILRVDAAAEVLVVDDDSPDGTATVVEKYVSQSPRVHLMVRKVDRGRGKAGVAGFLRALEMGADCVIEMDGDFSHHPRYIPIFLNEINYYDVVIGSRFVKGGAERDRNLTRQLLTKFASVYIRMLYGVRVRDCTSGFRCFRKAVLDALPLREMTSWGPSIVEEILYACHLGGFSFKEIPIIFEDRKRGKSNLTVTKVVDTFVMILRIRFSPAWK